jgi:hypothetical protein
VKRATEEVAVKKAAEERAAEEVVAKAAAAEAAGAVGGSPTPARHCQRPGPRGLRLRVAPPRWPNIPTGVF